MATRYIIVDGERRWRAAKAAGIKTLKAVVMKARPSEIDLLMVRASVDFHHLRHTWGERIDMACSLQDATDCTINDVASKLRISQPLATKLCKGRDVAPEVRQALDEGVIDIEKLYIIAGQPDHAKQLELLKGADGVTRDQLRSQVRRNDEPGSIRTTVARFPLPNGVTVTVQGPKMNLADAIRVLLAVLKELKRGLAEQLDITTVIRAMRDRCKASS